MVRVVHSSTVSLYNAEISSHPTHHFAVQTSEDKSKLESTSPTCQAEISQEYALHYRDD